MLNTISGLSHLILRMALQDKYCWYQYFIAAEAQVLTEIDKLCQSVPLAQCWSAGL